jgi:hypothetical protein
MAITKVFETIKNAPAFYYRREREDIGKEAGVWLRIY